MNLRPQAQAHEVQMDCHKQLIKAGKAVSQFRGCVPRRMQTSKAMLSKALKDPASELGCSY